MKWNMNRVRCWLTAVVIFALYADLCHAEGKPEFKCEKEKESYSLGYQFGGSLKRQPVDLDLEVIIRGVRDAYDRKRPRLSPEEMIEIMRGLKKKAWIIQQKRYQEEITANLREGEAFLAENAKKKGVIVLPSGLQYKVLREGNGPIPKATDTVKVHYFGTLINGTEFDSSYARGEPSTLHVFGVIKGWTEALQRMKVGSKWQLFVPPSLGYGKRRFGRIPPNSTLIFELELLAVAEGPVQGSREPSSPKSKTAKINSKPAGE
jgi:FKBP-type peptidyl-prolyl cis-trans isomerase FklB